METYSYLSRLCDIFFDCGIIDPACVPDEEYYISLFGDRLFDSSDIIQLVCKSRMSPSGKVFHLYIDYYSCCDIMTHRTHIFYNRPISDYCFRKLRKLLKKNGYI